MYQNHSSSHLAYSEYSFEPKIKEACGVFGIFCPSGQDAALSIYYGLCALQHRGQESCGIAVSDTSGPLGNISFHKDLGVVSEVFHSEVLNRLHGNIGVGHVRYSTTGANTPENAQPLVLKYLKGTLALAHNGNLTNTDTLRQKLERQGAFFHTTTDSEIIAHYIARERPNVASIEEAVKKTLSHLKGAYALVITSPRKLIGVRDPLGLKPLCLGRRGDSWILSSESCAFSALNAEFVRDIRPGEIIVITENGIFSDFSLEQETKAHCIFEYIYFSRLDSIEDGVCVYDARLRAGAALAASFPADADIVTGVPDSGIPSALGYAEASGIPFVPVFYKNSYIGRTFIKPTQKERESAVQLKLSVLESAVRGKRIILIDDSIVRGTTMARLIEMLKKAGALSIHVRISSPPFLYPCYFGTDVPSNRQLIAHLYSHEELCQIIGADSLEYLKLEDLQKMVGNLPLCKACFDEQYPCEIPNEPFEPKN